MLIPVDAITWVSFVFGSWLGSANGRHWQASEEGRREKLGYFPDLLPVLAVTVSL